MRAGEIVGDRFVIENLAGSGGMGAVYRAVDRTTGLPVAVKIVHARGREVERFMHESRTLAELSHPAIVRYVAHGASVDGHVYLAMEWLDGEDLDARLEREPLDPRESLALVRRAASALAVAHARGFVHRDVKPSNLFLCERSPAELKVVDFGAAWHETRSRGMTRSGAVLGTAGYVSPEQVLGERDFDARTDVFALGCVLFECITGQPAFAGEHIVAVLAKVITEDAPRIRDHRPDLPAELDDLVSRMLAKQKHLRPADGAAVVTEIDALGSVSGGVTVRVSGPPERITGAEQRFVSIILAQHAKVSHLAATIRVDGPEDPGGLRSVTAMFGGELLEVANGTLLVRVPARGTAVDQAEQAASCALALFDARPDMRVALATGRAETTRRLPVGPAIDRAVVLLSDLEREGVRVDEVTASLLSERFELAGEAPHRRIVAKRADVSGGRTLLGKKTPCVGREKEIALLEATLSECANEPVARAILVTAPAGTGKSRLRHEFTSRAASHAAVFVARAEPVAVGSSLGLVRRLLRDAFRVCDGDARPSQDAALTARASKLFPYGTAPHVVEFVRELCGVPSDLAPSGILRTARQDPRVMNEWLSRAFEAWLRAESQLQTVVLVLEDLHWGDLSSVGYISGALRQLTERPVMVLALARPEVHDLFPRLFAEVNVQEVRLGGLTRKASERLVRAALGEEVAPANLARIVDLADGNAFYLEELIRRVAEGSGDLPETVLAMVESRLERVEPEARRILRAASVYGQMFRKEGVVALLGEDGGASDIGGWLETLAERELLVAASGTLTGRGDYGFRHALSREAAYATLTPADRARGHRLAGEWLERTSFEDPTVMADHFERGGDMERALPWIARAAHAALDGGNPNAAIALAERGIATGASGELRGTLRGLQATAFSHTGEMRRVREVEREALALLTPGSAAWFTAAGWAVFASVVLGEPSDAIEVLRAVMGLEGPPPAVGAFAQIVFFLALALYNGGQDKLALELVSRLERVTTPEAEQDAGFAGHCHLTKMLVAAYTTGDLGAALRHAGEAIALFDVAAHRFAQAFALNQAAWIGVDAGAFDDARAHAEEGDRVGREVGAPFFSEWSALWKAKADVFSGRHAPAEQALESLRASPNPTLAVSAQAFTAEAHLSAGRLDAAEREARAVIERSVLVNTSSLGWAVIARVELARGRADEALVAAERGLATFGERLEVRIEGGILHLARAESLVALGRDPEARVAIDRARDRLMRIAKTLERDAPARTAFLGGIEWHSRTLTLAEKLEA